MFIELLEFFGKTLEYNDLKINGDMIYQKQEGTLYTWKSIQSIDLFINGWFTKFNPPQFLKVWKEKQKDLIETDY